jgi:hypothetical protein
VEKPLPATVPIPSVFVPPPRPAPVGATAGDTGGELGGLFPAAIGVGVCVGAWLVYEAWNPVSDRRRAARP